MIDLNNYPELNSRTNTAFFKDLTAEDNVITYNGKDINWGIYNLILTKRDLHMWVKCKMKPNKEWTVTAAKQYFGLKGSGQKLIDQLNAIKSEVDEILNIQG
tara:strand:+ start:205 stop:510 length:306 start_codon:yes stop_codon:yes gene_type:complete